MIFLLVCCAIIYFTWLIYIYFALILVDGEPQLFKGMTVVVAAGYLLLIVGSMLFVQYRAVGANFKKLSASFYVLLGVTAILFILAGLMMAFDENYRLFGIAWITIIVYGVLNILFLAQKLIIDAIFSALFVIGGITLLVISESSQTNFVGITVVYFGVFLFSLGSFIAVWI